MPVIDFGKLDTLAITPQHSDARGELVTGASIEVGRLAFKKGQKSEPHSHPQEQIVIVLSGRLIVTLDGEESEIGPGKGYHAPPYVSHCVRALEDSVLLSCKNVLGGVGHAL